MVIAEGVGARLREERERKGLSRDDLSEITGKSRNTQLLYESGKNAPDTNYLTVIAEADFDVFYILTGQRSGGDALSTNESAIIDMVRGFSDQQRAALITIMRSMLGSGV